jgi:alkylation response protein AidB-like acyl-CoA dehydrogenase
MDFGLGEHHAMLRESLARFLSRNAPRDAARNWDRENRVPREALAALAELGVFGMTFEEEWGGLGRDIAGALLVVEMLSRRSMALAVPYIMGAFYAGMNLRDCGSQEQKSSYLPRIAKGEMLFAYAWTEPDTGSDLAAVRTIGTIEGETIILSGAKRFCTGGDIADVLYTLVRTGPVEDTRRNLSFVLVPRDTPGLTVTPIATMGFKGAGTTDIVFDNVRVPISAVMGGRAGLNHGWKQLTQIGLDVEKLEVAAMALGLAEAAFEDAWRYAEERRQFGQRISGFQSIRHLLADMRTALQSARLMLRWGAMLAQAETPAGAETAMVKLHVCETAKRICQDAQTILGAYGYASEYDVERYVRDSLLMPIIGGSAAIQRNNIANWLRLAKG